MVALTAVPVHATDFSGYVECTTYNVTPGAGKWQSVVTKGGEVEKVIYQMLINNNEEFPLNDAIMLAYILQVEYVDEFGVSQTTTDPALIAQLVRVVNSEEMWQGGYVLWLGTIKAGGAKRLTVILWILNVVRMIQYDWELWYLP